MASPRDEAGKPMAISTRFCEPKRASPLRTGGVTTCVRSLSLPLSCVA